LKHLLLTGRQSTQRSTQQQAGASRLLTTAGGVVQLSISWHSALADLGGAEVEKMLQASWRSTHQHRLVSRFPVSTSCLGVAFSQGASKCLLCFKQTTASVMMEFNALG
jgi:hypothetical protein